MKRRYALLLLILAPLLLMGIGPFALLGQNVQTVSAPVLGAELVTNGDFTSDVGWVPQDASWAIAGGVATCVKGVGSSKTLLRNESLPSGGIFKTKFDLTLTSGSTYGIYISTSITLTPVTSTTGVGSGWYLSTSSGPTNLGLYASISACNFTVDNFSTKQATLPSLLAPTRQFSGSGRFYTTATTTNCATGEWLGTWAYTDSTTNPTKALWAFINRTTGNAELRVVTNVSGGAITSTSLINTAVTFSSGAQLVLVVDMNQDGDGKPYATMFYNNAIVGTRQDLSAYSSWVKVNRKHAIFSTTAVTPGSVVFDYNSITYQADLFNPGAGTFDSGTLGWIAQGGNLLVNDSGMLKCTYIDNVSGASFKLQSGDGLSVNPVQGGLYRFDVSGMVNGGSNVSFLYSGISYNYNLVFTETSLTSKSIYFIIELVGTNILLSGMGAGEIIWLDNLTLRRVQ